MNFISPKKYALHFFLIAVLFSMNGWAGEDLPGPESYFFNGREAKKSLDDPTDLFVTQPFESFLPPECVYGEFYDQKGRLYRTMAYAGLCFLPEHGMITTDGSFVIMRDHIDVHSTLSQTTVLPAAWHRTRFSMQYLVKRGK